MSHTQFRVINARVFQLRTETFVGFAVLHLIILTRIRGLPTTSIILLVLLDVVLLVRIALGINRVFDPVDSNSIEALYSHHNARSLNF